MIYFFFSSKDHIRVCLWFGHVQLTKSSLKTLWFSVPETCSVSTHNSLNALTLVRCQNLKLFLLNANKVIVLVSFEIGQNTLQYFRKIYRKTSMVWIDILVGWYCRRILGYHRHNGNASALSDMFCFLDNKVSGIIVKNVCVGVYICVCLVMEYWSGSSMDWRFV